jgi:hypothetical protein
MDPKSPGLWLMPTRGRALTNLPKFFAAAAETGMTTPGVIVIDRDDYAQNHEGYDALVLPENWRVLPVRGGCCAKATQEALVELLDGLHWIGWLGDDLVPKTPEWDVEAISSLTGWNCVSTNDEAHAPKKFNGATVWSADLVRAVGYLYPPGLQHMYIDDVWEEIARLSGCWQCRMDIVVKHDHAMFNGAKDATTAHTVKFWADDERAFTAWKEHGLLEAAQAALDLMEAHGVKMIRPDFKGVRLMIATPCASGRYERLFMGSLFETRRYLEQFGAQVHFAELPYCSDITLARNKLLGSFLRSSDTHMLWVDDDMAWRPQDITPLLMAGEDFVAVAGPRKVFPPSYAVNVSDDHGRPVAVRQDGKTGFLEVTGIGFAFALVTRAWAERMRDSYQDLAFVGADGREDVGVFNPIIVNKRYLSEDFAACHRWRQLGGRILVAAEIELGHTGAHTWNGSWWAQLVAKMQTEQAA